MGSRSRSIAIPPLGSGLGELNWKEVHPRFERSLEGIEGLEVMVYGLKQLQTPGWGEPDSRTGLATGLSASGP